MEEKVLESQLGCNNCSNTKVHCKNLCHTCYQKQRRQTLSGKLLLNKYNTSKNAKEAQKRYYFKNVSSDKKCNCGKPVHCKELCRSCYQKALLRAKKPLISVPHKNTKHTLDNPCECGKPAICKNMCRTCYSKDSYKRRKSLGLIIPDSLRPISDKKCECGKPAVCKNMCRNCYSKEQYKTRKSLGLIIPNSLKPISDKKCDCGKPVYIKNMCRSCYSRQIVYSPIEILPIYNKVLEHIDLGLTISYSLKLQKVISHKFYRSLSPIQKNELITNKKIATLSKNLFPTTLNPINYAKKSNT